MFHFLCTAGYICTDICDNFCNMYVHIFLCEFNFSVIKDMLLTAYSDGLCDVSNKKYTVVAECLLEIGKQTS